MKKYNDKFFPHRYDLYKKKDNVVNIVFREYNQI